MPITEEVTSQATSGLFSLIGKFLRRLRPSPVRILLSDGTPSELAHPAGALGLCHRTWRLQVTNRGHTALECIAKLEAMTCTDDPKFQNAFLPIALITQHQSGQGRAGGSFNLRPGEVKLVEVASLDETVENSEIRLHYETSNYPCQVPRARYKLKVSIYGAHKPREFECFLYVDGTGRLRLRAAA